jgi:succinyl-diaminopimelate desuccinylase
MHASHRQEERISATTPPESELTLEILSGIAAEGDTVGDLAASLVAIPSENAPGDVTEVMTFAEQHLREAGLTVERLQPAPGRVNLVATVDSGRAGAHVILNAHLDTFPIGDLKPWTRPPQARTIEDDAIYGRGATDMKGGAAVFMKVLSVLNAVRDRLSGRVTLTLVCDEETFGPHGARSLLDERPDLVGDVLLSTEPSSTGVIRHAEKGMAWGECTFRSRGGHAAYPSTHPSAIEAACAFITDLQDLPDRWPPSDVVFAGDPLARTRQDEAVQPGSADALTRVVVNAGVINGGTSVNMRADLCSVKIDVRVPLGIATREVIEAVRDLASEHGGEYDVWSQSEPNASDRDHRIFTLLGDHAEAINGSRPLLACGLGCTDARLWRAKGIPSAVYGPSPATMAAPDEQVSETALRNLIKIHALTVAGFLLSDE